MNKAFIASVILSLIAILLLPKPSLSVFLVLLVDIFIFSTFSKTDDEKIASLLALGALSLIALALGGIKTGIDFSGGTRIVISLSQPVDQATMNEILDKLKGRISAFGLEQVVVTGVGNNLIYLDVPSTDETFPERIEQIISQQGRFIAIVDGEVVLTGRDILPGTVYTTFRADQIGGADWGVSFSITPEANIRFLEKVKGKANRPIYMFLDPVENAYIILSREKIKAPQQVLEVLTYLNNTLVYEEDLDKVTIPENVTLITSLEQFKDRPNTIIVNESELYPEYGGDEQTGYYIKSWKVIGLVSAPLVSPNLASGKTAGGLNYLITGTVAPGQDPIQEAKYIASVLKGGAFPVKLEVSGITRIPPVLGEETFKYSLAGIWIAVLLISIYLALRYKKLNIFIPLFITTLIENLVLLTIVGQFTLDLAAMAGLIAAAGISIDGQIIITDMFRRNEVKQAFEIIKNNTYIALVIMLPLIAVGSPEVVGFGITTAIAYVLGYLVSRNSYYALLKKFYK
ncbi:MAG: hypothetical protein GXN92_02200 [Candidatus Micrarchaeota archaeon]|nr:hypothetical protein [Candidatus Micrarchaeota archaeon]